ncbi:MAG TPA: nucleotidyltransferase family protein [Gracilimonas sp.]|uniref:nucleotidyltransferase family protein n=1 Tax=Gracilimonas sp. TaxID=1974203 RepID=UPI002D87F65F|nr:nucleotidyltransferase family protein [Gracilimonas sp.]
MAVKTLHTKEQILKLLKDNRELIKEFGVSKLGLFGSYAKGEQTEDSDLDFYVEFENGKKTFDNLMELAFYLEDNLERKVDLLTDKSVSERFRNIMEKNIQYVELHS